MSDQPMSDMEWIDAQADAEALRDAADLARHSGVATRSTIASLIHKLREQRSMKIVEPPRALYVVRRSGGELETWFDGEMPAQTRREILHVYNIGGRDTAHYIERYECVGRTGAP